MDHPRPLNILIADDHPVWRLGFKELLSHATPIKNIWEAGDGVQAIRQLQHHRIDVLFLDLNMPKLDGFDVLDALKKFGNERPKTILVSMIIDRHQLMDAYHRGIDGFITKNSDLAEIRRMLERLMDDDDYYSPSVHRTILKGLKQELETVRSGEYASLSDIEKRVLRCICRQMTNEEISKEVQLSTYTIKRHRQRIYEKIDAKNVVGFIFYALKNGIITSEEIEIWGRT